MIGTENKHAEVKRLRRERDELEERVRQLETAVFGLKDTAEAMQMGLSPTEYEAFLVLRRHGCASRSALMTTLYSHRPGDMPDERSIDVLIFKLRKKLKPKGYVLIGQWGTGWRLLRESGGDL